MAKIEYTITKHIYTDDGDYIGQSHSINLKEPKYIDLPFNIVDYIFVNKVKQERKEFQKFFKEADDNFIKFKQFIDNENNQNNK